MDCDILPQVASDWIVSYLNHLSQSSQSIARYWSSPNREQHFRRFGLANLYVPELKAIGKRIESSSRLEGHNLPDWVKPKASAKKADWTQALQLFFGGTNDLTLAFLSRRDWTTSNSFVAPDWSNNSNTTESSSATGAWGSSCGASSKVINQQTMSATNDVPLAFLSRQDWTTSSSFVAPDWSNNNNTTESSSATGAWGGSCGASSKVIKQQMISTTSTPSMEKAATSSTDKIKKRPLSKITPESNCIENRQTKKASDGTTVWIDLSTAAGEAAANRMWPKSRIRIKQEKTVCSPQHQRQQNQAIEENRLLFPRNHQEFSMISHMRVMGFTNDQEILAGLRHVEQQRDPMELRLGLYSMGQHLDAALIWIVNQREEAEEAKKLDEGRLASEMAMVEEHRQGMKNDIIRMQEASVDDILGCEENEHGISMPSSWFPFSVVLQSSEIRSALCSVLDNKNLDDRNLVMSYLQLEAKARKWYGTVVPWCYFHYLQVPNKLADSAEEWLRAKVDELKHAMYTLAEQEENGVGAVPRIFLVAQRKCVEQGLPDLPPSCSINSDDDNVIILS